MNIIQINGIRGLILAGFIICCLVAGFIVFPGWLGMQAWNYISSYFEYIPAIGIFQGMLLWGIILSTYFIFRKNRMIVCFRSPQTLSDKELKSVFSNMKKQTLEDPILQAMLKAREAELKYKAQQKNESESELAETTDSTKV